MPISSKFPWKSAAILLLLLLGCGGGGSMPLAQKVTVPAENPVTAPVERESSTDLPELPQIGEDNPTFKGSVSGSFKKYCGSCHNAASENSNLLSYTDAFSRRKEILERVVVKKDMPPEMPLPDSERTLIMAWLRAGAPEGDDETGARDGDSHQRPRSGGDYGVPQPYPPRPRPVEPVEPVEPVPISSSAPAPVFRGEVEALLRKNCTSCHGSAEPRQDWADYRFVKENLASLLDRVIIRADMPANAKLTPTEKESILLWVRSGAPYDRQSSARVSFKKQIRPLLEKACTSCHGPENSDRNWLDYRVAYRSRGKLLDRVVIQRDMPPAAPNSAPLSDSERALFEKWIESGAPADLQGD